MARLKRLLPILLLAGLAAAPSAAAAGAREPFFPRAGNRGYDVSSYEAKLRYAPSSGRLRARVAIEATATQGLSRFSLDLYGLRVGAVSVAGQRARFSRGRGKLRIVPARRLAAGESFGIVVAYSGRPRRVLDPDGTSEGWNRTDDGAFAVGEPVGTPSWLVCNNAPADKAFFSFDVTVPAKLRAVANGRLTAVERGRSLARFRWEGGEPMAAYLAVLAIGRGSLAHDRAAGVPSWTLVDPRYAEHQRALAALPRAIRFFGRLFGPYPFDSAGSIVDYAPELGYALETQTRPIYAFAPDAATVAHETAHQWFGDSVGLRRWPEIWLNEGLATWAQWYFAERHGGPSAARTFRRLYATPASRKRFWDPPSARLGSPLRLFGHSVYARGGMAVQALREQVGTRALLRAMRRWATERRHGTGTIREFEALAAEVSGEDLRPLFQRWLRRPGKPPL